MRRGQVSQGAGHVVIVGVVGLDARVEQGQRTQGVGAALVTGKLLPAAVDVLLSFQIFDGVRDGLADLLGGEVGPHHRCQRSNQHGDCQERGPERFHGRPS